eukprot:2107893-Lingulodinium_polyedra.AAC.1
MPALRGLPGNCPRAPKALPGSEPGRRSVGWPCRSAGPQRDAPSGLAPSKPGDGWPCGCFGPGPRDFGRRRWYP